MSIDRNKLIEVFQSRIPEQAMRFTYSRSSGPGGQNVNKVATRATLWFNVADSPWLADWEKQKLIAKLPGRMNAEGQLHITSMRHRTQPANRRACIERFYKIIADALAPVRTRKKTKVPSGVRRRRLDEKRRRGDTKSLRRFRRGSAE